MFKDRLRKLREEKDITQRELGAILGIGSTAVNGYETGDSTPNFDRLIKLANYFNVSIDYLCGRTSIKSVAQEDNIFDIASKLQNIMDCLQIDNAVVSYRRKLLTPAEKELVKSLLSTSITNINNVLKKISV